MTVTFSVTVKNPDTGDKILVNTVTSATAGSNCPAGSTDAGCTSTVTVLVPGLEIAVSAGTSSTTPGSVVHYTVTVTNSGQTPYTGAAFTDPLAGILDDAAYDGDAAATSGSVSYASPDLSWTGDLAVGAAATITFSVTVNNPDTGNKILASTITSATTGSNCAAGSGDLPCTSTVPVAVLTITNSSDVSTAQPGSVVRFTAVFTNAGQVPYTGITIATNITDVVDDATPDGDQTATSGTLTLTSTGISWTGSIPVGGTVTVTGTVTVNSPDTGNKLLASTITTAAAGSNCPAGTTDPRCSISVTVLTPALTITQTADVATTSPGATVHYTVTVTDTGQTPYTGATVTDQLDGVLEDAAYNGDAAASTGTVSFASPDLTWTGNLAAGASATITYSVTVNNPDTGDRTLTNTVVSASAGSNCPVGGTDPRCTVTVPDLVPGLDIVTSADKATATPGTTVHYTITVTNTGQTTYTGAGFTDPLSGVLDDAAYNADAAATAGSVSFASPDLTWTGNLAPGAAATVTFSVTVRNPDTGDKSLAATVTSATAGNNCPAAGGTDTACTTTIPVVSATTLTFTATADTAAAAAGGVVHYTITVANSGLIPYTGAAVTAGLGGVLDDAAYGHDATATAGTVTFTSPDLTWTGDVPASGTVTISYSVTVNSPDTGNRILTSTLTSASAGSNCGTGSADPRCTATVNVAALAITATADVSTATPGSDVHYTITAANTGQAPYSDATITLHLADTSEDATYNGDLAATSGTITTDTTTGTATWTGDLAPGAAVTLTYTITVTDTGQTPYAGAVVTDDLTGVIDDSAYNADAAATAGTGHVHQPGPDLDREPDPRPGRHRHLHRHRP